MKRNPHLRTCIAVAAILSTASSTSFAQNVTIYGKVDLSLSKMNGGDSRIFGGGAGVANKWSLKPGSDGVLGFRGEEDLGGGMKARFKLESRFNPTDGSLRATATTQNPPPAWWGESSVGFDTPWGSLDMGRLIPPPGAIPFLADPFRWDTVGQISGYVAPNGFGANDIVRYNNGIIYRSPRFADGFSVTLGAAASNGSPRGSGRGFNVVYAKGPLWVGFGYDVRKSETRDSISIATLMYDFGPVKPILSMSQTEVAGVKKSFYSIGATAPLGAGELKAVYASAHPRLFPTPLAPSTKKFAVGYHYPLSKRTKVYTDLATAKAEGFTRATGFDVGLQVSF
jgi:predicted porin